jgi:hypothetical protein
MEGRAQQSPGQDAEPVASGRWRDLGLLALLLGAAVGLRAWLLCHTEVAARDSIGFIRYALEFQGEIGNKSWAEVLRTNHQHPGYPLAVLAVSLPVRAFVHAPMPDLMRISAQLASSLAAILLVVPMYFIGKLLLNRATGFWAALMFQCLPVTGHLLSDGLSEALFLLLTATALLLAGLALHSGSWRRYALCGVFCGLAYLTRPEGALVLVATGLSLLGLQALPVWRRPWRRTLACGLTLTVAALATGSPYFLTIGGFSAKPSARQLMGQEVDKPPQARGPGEGLRLAGDGPPLAAVPAVILSTDGSLTDRLARGLWGLGTELVNGFHYVGWVPALLGMWWNFRRVRHVPAFLPLVILGLLHGLVLWRLAVVVGYLSDRHIQVMVLCGIYPVATALLELPGRLRGWLDARGWLDRAPALGALLTRGGPALSLLLLVALTGWGLPKTLHTLHQRRAGYHAAGLWLGEHAHPSDTIYDRHAWAHYYAGRVFVEGQPIHHEPDHHPVSYHVIGKPKDGADPEPPLQERFPCEKKLRKLGATVVYHWPPDQPSERASVFVYALRHEDDAEAEEFMRQIRQRGARPEGRGENGGMK